jgi:hypothetical protein
VLWENQRPPKIIHYKTVKWIRASLLAFIAPVLFAGCISGDEGAKTLSFQRDGYGQIVAVTETRGEPEPNVIFGNYLTSWGLQKAFNDDTATRFSTKSPMQTRGLK